MELSEFGLSAEVEIITPAQAEAYLANNAHHRKVKQKKVDEYMKSYGYKEENFRPDAVAILYVDVPENSSNLVICRDGDDYVPIDDFKKEDMYWLKPTEGELVIHSPDIWHAVSVHNSDLPRNVFVFDIDYV